MPTDRFNEAERYVLQNWRQAHLVEKSMGEIRAKYASICDRVAEAITATHKEVDWHEVYVTQFTFNGYIGIGKQTWPGQDVGGIINMDYLRLEHLLDENAEHPYIGVYAGTARKPLMSKEAIKRLHAAADTLLTKQELDLCVKENPSTYDYVLWYALPESKNELMEMLLDGDGKLLVDCFVEHFNVFAKFVLFLDDVFSETRKTT